MPEVTTTEHSEHSTAPKGIPLDNILHYLQQKNLTAKDTAKLVGCSERNVYNRLKSAGILPDTVQKYIDNRAKVFSTYQALILNSISPDDLKKASFSQKMMGFGILYDKERLETGKSTQNQAHEVVLHLSKQVESIDKQLKELGE